MIPATEKRITEIETSLGGKIMSSVQVKFEVPAGHQEIKEESTIQGQHLRNRWLPAPAGYGPFLPDLGP